jgi:acyl carrier protein
MTALARARTLVAEALAMPESDLPADIRIGSIDQWDSLAHARILLALEETVGRQLDAADAAIIESPAEIAALLVKFGKE